MDSVRAVQALHELDPGFIQLVETLFSKAADPVEVWEYLYGQDGVAKMMGPDPSSVHVPAPVKAAGGVLVPKPPANGSPTPVPMAAPKVPMKATVPKAQGVLKMVSPPVDEEDGFSVIWAGEFSKTDTDRRQAFGWASVVEINGEPVIDLQGDWITPEEIEKAAYAYVRTSRVGGTQHARDEFDRPVRAGDLIESVVYTDEKYEALAKSMNVDPSVFDEAPRGWWTGFQYDDDATWADIKTGRKTGFSLHGRGKRLPVPA